MYFCQIFSEHESICDTMTLCKMSILLKYVVYLYASTSIFGIPSVKNSPVIIKEEKFIKPRLPENICFNEALDEGGKLC